NAAGSGYQSPVRGSRPDTTRDEVSARRRRMSVLDRLYSPADLRDLDPAELDVLATECREFLVRSVCRTGGHLGPNLGAVELTIALHRVFETPATTVVFDTG